MACPLAYNSSTLFAIRRSYKRATYLLPFQGQYYSWKEFSGQHYSAIFLLAEAFLNAFEIVGRLAQSQDVVQMILAGWIYKASTGVDI